MRSTHDLASARSTEMTGKARSRARSFGVVGVVFGGLTALQSATELRGFLARRGTDLGAVDEVTRHNVERMQLLGAVGTPESAIMLVLALAALGIGALLLRERPGAVRLARTWAVVVLVVLIGRAVAFETVTLPRYRQLLESFGGAYSLLRERAALSGMAHMLIHLRLLGYAIYPACLLVWLRPPTFEQEAA